MLALHRSALAALVLLGCSQRDDEVPTGHGQQGVIGGDPVAAGEYPATGALVLFGSAACTGTLIAPDVVLTAGHCVDPDLTFGQVPGFTLVTDAREPAPADVVVGARGIAHPQFDLNADLADGGLGTFYDIGLLRLAEPITGVTPEALPTPAEAAAALAPGAVVELVGYGLTQQNPDVFGVKAKGTGMLTELNDTELFIGKAPHQNCFGDSGGPGFVALEGGQRRFFGIVSRGPDDNLVCDHGGIDTRVDAYLGWIDEALAGLDAGPIAPDAGQAGTDAGIGGDGGAGCCAVAGRARAVPTGTYLWTSLGLAALVAIRRRRAR